MAEFLWEKGTSTSGKEKQFLLIPSSMQTLVRVSSLVLGKECLHSRGSVLGPEWAALSKWKGSVQ